MTATHKIRSPEWAHIHERDNQIIDLEAKVERLRLERDVLSQTDHQARAIRAAVYGLAKAVAKDQGYNVLISWRDLRTDHEGD